MQITSACSLWKRGKRPPGSFLTTARMPEQRAKDQQSTRWITSRCGRVPFTFHDTILNLESVIAADRTCYHIEFKQRRKKMAMRTFNCSTCVHGSAPQSNYAPVVQCAAKCACARLTGVFWEHVTGSAQSPLGGECGIDMHQSCLNVPCAQNGSDNSFCTKLFFFWYLFVKTFYHFLTRFGICS